jgi:hypothetical protein
VIGIHDGVVLDLASTACIFCPLPAFSARQCWSSCLDIGVRVRDLEHIPLILTLDSITDEPNNETLHTSSSLFPLII